jgi:hypothetical protein
MTSSLPWHAVHFEASTVDAPGVPSWQAAQLDG